MCFHHFLLWSRRRCHGVPSMQRRIGVGLGGRGGTRFSEEVAGLKVCVRVRSQYQSSVHRILRNTRNRNVPFPRRSLPPQGYRLRWVRGGWVGARYPSPPPLPPPLPLTPMPTPPSWKSGMDHRRDHGKTYFYYNSTTAACSSRSRADASVCSFSCRSIFALTTR